MDSKSLLLSALLWSYISGKFWFPCFPGCTKYEFVFVLLSHLQLTSRTSHYVGHYTLVWGSPCLFGSTCAGQIIRWRQLLIWSYNLYFKVENWKFCFFNMGKDISAWLYPQNYMYTVTLVNIVIRKVHSWFLIICCLYIYMSLIVLLRKILVPQIYAVYVVSSQ